MHKPLIGVIPLVDTEKESYWMLPGYMNGLLQSGGMPVMLPLTADRSALRQFAGELDGFLFTGGQDVSPDIYGESPLPACGESCDLRDDMERALLTFALEQDKPILGICRGIQLVNAALGGNLYQDLPSQHPSNIEHHQSPPYDKPVHTVKIVENTPLYSLLGKSEIQVNSYHHQAAKALAPGLLPMAYSPDGLVEAVYAPDKKHVRCVQWHPEFSYLSDENSRLIFENFINSMK